MSMIKNDRLFLTAFFIFVILQFLDTFLTGLALENGAIERNPIIIGLYYNGELFVYAYKLFFACIIAIVIYWINAIMKLEHIGAVWFFILDMLYVLICVNNWLWMNR